MEEDEQRKFRVIPGGGKGPPDINDVRARAHLRDLIIEILRGVARGDDHQVRIARHLVDLSRAAHDAPTPLAQHVDDVLAGIAKQLAPAEHVGHLSDDIEAVVTAALRLAAETCATDGFAAGRASQRKFELLGAIEQLVVGRETRSRENGRSYLGRLQQNHFPPAVRAKRRRQTTRRKKPEPDIKL